MSVMLRVDPETRDRVMRVARDDFGGVSADEALQRLLEEHWERQAVAVMEQFRAEDPDGWKAYLAEAEQWDAASAPIVDGWDEHAA